MHDCPDGATGSRGQIERRTCGTCQGVLYVESARDSLVGPRVDGWEWDPGRLQRSAPLCGRRGYLFLRRHVPDADLDRRQSDHGIQRVCLTPADRTIATQFL